MTVRRNGLRNFVLITLGAASCLAMAWLVVLPRVMDLFGPPFAYPFDDRPFDRSTWLSAFGGPQNPRGTMAVDVIQNHIHAGMTMAAVRALLGKSDRDEKAADLYPESKSGERIWTYRLGNWSGFRIDEDFLAVLFDENGKVVRAWHYQS